MNRGLNAVLTTTVVIGLAPALPGESASTRELIAPGILAPGTYDLLNHPSNGRVPPGYGLRLDELIDVDPNRNDVFTFDFEASGAAVFLEFDGTSMHIYGTAYGGRDIGTDYDPNYEGFVQFDMTYSTITTNGTDDDHYCFTPDYTNRGTITLWDNTVVDLYDYSGSFGYTLRVGNGEDDTGLDGWPGVGGAGWLSFLPSDEGRPGGQQDWSFVVQGPFGAHGCTPGYWKNHPASWGPTGLNQKDTVESVFDVPDGYGLDNDSLKKALKYPGGRGQEGAARILLRAAVAAVLNAAHPEIQYPMAYQEIINAVNAALASGERATMLNLATTLDEYNNLGCPID